MMETEVPVLRQTFGEFIKSARLSQNLSQKEVAGRARLEQAYVSKVERDLRDPCLTIALRLCAALDVDINDYIRQLDNETPD